MNQYEEMSKHHCALKKSTRGLPPLAPNASRWVKFKRWMRLMSLLDEKNRRCIQFFGGTAGMKKEFFRHVKNRDKLVIHPFSRLSDLISLLFFFSWGIQLWGLPIYYAIALDLEESLSPITVCLMAFVQSISIVSFFFTGYVNDKTKTIIIDHRMICKHYLKTFFVPDFIAVVGPVAHLASPLSPEQKGVENDLEFMYRYFVLFSYFVRLRSLKKTMVEILVITGLSEVAVFVIDRLLWMALIIHLLSSLVISIPWMVYDSTYPEESWFKQAGMHNITEAGISTIYTHSFLMTCCYFFGVSHGGYHITVPNEEITMFMVSLLGRLYTLFMIADILRCFGLATVSESRSENIMSMLSEYINSKDLPPHMRFKLLEYCKYKLHGRYINERAIFRTLSDHIQKELLLYHAKELLVKIPVFQVLPKERLGALLADMQSKLYSPGDKIVTEGDAIGDVYFIKCGTVALYHEGAELCHLEDGHTFGDIGNVFPDYTHHQFTYIAIDYAELYTLRKNIFKRLLSEYSEVKRYFETECNKKLKMFENMKKNAMQYRDVISELRGEQILEKLKLKHTHFLSK